MKRRLIRFAAMAAAVVMGAAGCGESGPKLVPVTGTVTLNDKPLEGATITFLPDAANKTGRPGVDITGPSGNYKLHTDNRSGAMVGSYRVLIEKDPTAPPPGAADAADPAANDPFMKQVASDTAAAISKGQAKKKDQTQEKVSGEFKREVPPGGGVIDFDVKATTAAAAKAAGAAAK